jgi:hypothetical protein
VVKENHYFGPMKINPALFILAVITSLSTFGQTKLPVKTGNYDETVDLSYDKAKGTISGIIARTNNDNPNGPRISCSLLFISEPRLKTSSSNKYPVRFFNEGDTAEAGKGYVEITKDGINVKSNGFVSSCNNLMDLAGETGEPFTFLTAKAFITAGIVRSAKAPIYKTAADTAKTKMYLVKGNFISITSLTGNWVSFEYMTSSGKRIKGWLKKEDVVL